MERCYSVTMSPRHPKLPDLWLVTDLRNDHALEQALARLPRGSGVIFRHYHLSERERRARFATLRRAAHRKGHFIVLSGTRAEARSWRADGIYGEAGKLAKDRALFRLATAHSLREIASARRAGTNGVLLSPTFPTRSHPGAKALGPLRFRLLAARAAMPVIALGGMDSRRANRIAWRKWAAIDAFAASRPTRIPRILDDESPQSALCRANEGSIHGVTRDHRVR